MAYLRDMLDLSQPELNVQRVNGSSTPDLNNSKPTLGSRADQATNNATVVDRTRSVEGEEKQIKTDWGRGLRIVREIIECASHFPP